MSAGLKFEFVQIIICDQIPSYLDLVRFFKIQICQKCIYSALLALDMCSVLCQMAALSSVWYEMFSLA